MSRFNAPNLHNFRRQLRRRQDATVPRLRPLRQLDLNHLHVGQRGPLRKLCLAETSLFVARTEVAGTDLPDDVTTGIEVVRTQSTLSGIVREIAHLRARIEGEDGVLAQRAVAHP